MLFQSQRDELTGETGKIYFAGTTLLKNKQIAFITGVRTEQNPKEVVVDVRYLSKDGTIKQAFNKVLSAAEFERFLNEFAMKVATVSKGTEKLLEIKHNFKSIDDGQFSLDEKQKNVALRAYLLNLINGGTPQDAIRTAGSYIKKCLQEA